MGQAEPTGHLSCTCGISIVSASTSVPGFEPWRTKSKLVGPANWLGPGLSSTKRSAAEGGHGKGESRSPDQSRRARTGVPVERFELKEPLSPRARRREGNGVEVTEARGHGVKNGDAWLQRDGLRTDTEDGEGQWLDGEWVRTVPHTLTVVDDVTWSV